MNFFVCEVVLTRKQGENCKGNIKLNYFKSNVLKISLHTFFPTSPLFCAEYPALAEVFNHNFKYTAGNMICRAFKDMFGDKESLILK